MMVETWVVLSFTLSLPYSLLMNRSCVSLWIIGLCGGVQQS